MAAYQYIYTMRGLTKVYPGHRECVRDVTLAFLPGAKIGVLGVNGAGKSTLLRIMAGIDSEFSGEARVADTATVGYLPQEPELDPAKDVMGNVLEGVAGVKGLLDRFERGFGTLRRGALRRRDERADRRAGRAAGEDRRGQRLGAGAHRRDRAWTRCAARRATPT